MTPSNKNVYKTHKTLTADEFNALIDELDKYNIDYIFKHLACCATIETKSYIFECSLTDNKKEIINVGNISNQFHKQCKLDIPHDKFGYKETYNALNQKKVSWDYACAYGYSYANEAFARKPLKCWSYDINSAFAYAMLSPMPDTTKNPRYSDVIKAGEIGFFKLGGCTTDIGAFADIIFPLMDSPFKDYVINYYSKKQTAPDGSPEKRKWKDFLNIPTGLVARDNIFLRNAILYYSNKYIKSFIDDDTVYCNVDSIVSLRPRYDLPIGDGLGQFKPEHVCEDFKYIKPCQYQWGNECHYSGIPSCALEDIEKTDNWTQNLKYVIRGRKVYENKKS